MTTLITQAELFYQLSLEVSDYRNIDCNTRNVCFSVNSSLASVLVLIEIMIEKIKPVISEKEEFEYLKK